MPSDMRGANRRLNIDEYRGGKIQLASRPQYLIVELTQGCNLRCPMCRPVAITTRKRGMAPELFARIIKELGATAEMIDLRGWGESLILPEIAARIAEVAVTGAKIRFVTNLSFRRDDVLDVLAEHRCQLAVSVDCADPDLFFVLRGGARLEKVSDNLDRLVAAYRRRHGTSEGIYVSATLQRPAVNGLPALVDFVADRGINELRLFSVSVDSTSRLSLDNESDMVDGALQIASDRARKRGVRLFAGTLLGSMEPKRESDPCLHPWAYAYFAYDGRVGFCDHLIGEAGEPYLLGDLNIESFESIWNGLAWQRLRTEHLTTRDPHADRFDECHWCYKNRFVDFEHEFLPELECRRRRL